MQILTIPRVKSHTVHTVWQQVRKGLNESCVEKYNKLHSAVEVEYRETIVTCIHTYAHHTHTYAHHTDMYRQIHRHIHAQTHTCVHTDTHARACTHVHVRTHMDKQTDRQTYTDTLTVGVGKVSVGL